MAVKERSTLIMQHNKISSFSLNFGIVIFLIFVSATKASNELEKDVNEYEDFGDEDPSRKLIETPDGCFYSNTFLGYGPKPSNNWKTFKVAIAKYALINFTTGDFKQNMGYGFKIVKKKAKLVVSCTTFDVTCTGCEHKEVRLIIKNTDQTPESSLTFRSGDLPCNVKSKKTYVRIHFEADGPNIEGNLQCYITAVKNKYNKNIPSGTAPKYTSTTSTSTSSTTTTSTTTTPTTTTSTTTTPTTTSTTTTPTTTTSTTTTPTTTSTTTTPTTTSTTTTPTTTSTTTTPTSTSTTTTLFLNCQCGVSNGCGRVFGGYETCEHQYPWMVIIHTTTSSVQYFHCAGTIISDQWVITSYSCLHGMPASHLQVSVGNHDLTDTATGSSIQVIEIVDFGYDRFTHEADLALLKLDEKLDIVNNDTVLPICFPRDITYDGAYAYVTGWGSSASSGDVFTNMLHVVDGPVVSQTTCNTAHSGYILNSMICHGNASHEGCVLDDGAPLWYYTSSWQAELIGTRIWGEGCGTDNKPGVYTRISDFALQIYNAIAGSGMCEHLEKPTYGGTIIHG